MTLLEARQILKKNGYKLIKEATGPGSPSDYKTREEYDAAYKKYINSLRGEVEDYYDLSEIESDSCQREDVGETVQYMLDDITSFDRGEKIIITRGVGSMFDITYMGRK